MAASHAERIGSGVRVARRALAALALATAFAHAEPGDFPIRPPIERFAPDIEFYPANFAVAQDDRGVAYLGNQNGVLAFDGERWTLIPSVNHDIVRSLAWDPRGRLYVGGYNAIGWIERDATGAFVMHDLTPEIPGLAPDEPFADIWETLVLPEGVFFRGLKHVFRLDPESGRITVWRHPTRFGAMARDGADIVLQFRPEGLRRLVGDAWQPIAGTEAFQQLVERFVPLADGRLLALNKDGVWRTLRMGKVATIAMPVGTLSPPRYIRGLALDDGTVALATDDGQLHFLDLEHMRLRKVRVADEFISGLIRAHDGGLLIALDNTLTRVEYPSPWARLELEGVSGSLSGVSAWGGRRFVLTGAGLWEWVEDRQSGERFVYREWTTNAAHDLLPLDARRALLADNYALRLVEGDRVRDLTDRTFYPRRFVRSRFSPGIVFIGTELGLAVARIDGATPRVLFNLVEPRAPNITSIVETAQGEVIAGSERAGVRRLRFADDWSGVREDAAFAEGRGLEFGPLRRASVARFGALGVVAATEVGLFRLDGERFVPSDLDGLAALVQPLRTLTLAEAPDGTRWAFDFARVFRRAPGQPWRQEPVESVRSGAIEDIEFDRGAALLIASGAMLRHDPTAAVADARAIGVQLTAIERVEADGTRTRLPLDDATPQRFESGDYGIAFSYAAPELRRSGGARYRARLDGYGEPWTDWVRTSTFTYHRLAPGDYRLEIQSRDSRGIESAPIAWAFSVARPWYARPGFLALWLALALATAWTGTRAFVRQRTARLEALVSARTRELADANRKLDTIAHLDGLTGLPNRRRLDEYLAQVWAHCAERERPLALLAIDVDRFKDYNDRHGHLAGDTLLKRLAPILVRNLRRTEDLAARYGGEEFLVVLPGADAVIARDIAEALREKVASSSIGATVSIGVAAETPRAGREVTDLVALADGALYRAKAAGRDRVEVDGA